MNILIINGHPREGSFNNALADAYSSGAKESGATVDRIDLYKLEYDLNLKYGYTKRVPLEPDLVEAQKKLKWADHLVWIFPVWWGSTPALLKGFLDRVLLPGYAFKKGEGYKWEQFFKGKTARVISTLDQPPLYYKLVFLSPSTRAMKGLTMNFIGVKKVRTIAFGSIRLSTEAKRKKWLEKVRKLGLKNI